MDADLATHCLYQVLADCQAQPGTPVFSRRRVIGLLECREQAFLGLGRNANAGIPHLPPQENLVSVFIHHLGTQRDASCFGEFQ